MKLYPHSPICLVKHRHNFTLPLPLFTASERCFKQEMHFLMKSMFISCTNFLYDKPQFRNLMEFNLGFMWSTGYKCPQCTKITLSWQLLVWTSCNKFHQICTLVSEMKCGWRNMTSHCIFILSWTLYKEHVNQIRYLRSNSYTVLCFPI